MLARMLAKPQYPELRFKPTTAASPESDVLATLVTVLPCDWLASHSGRTLSLAPKTFWIRFSVLMRMAIRTMDGWNNHIDMAAVVNGKISGHPGSCCSTPWQPIQGLTASADALIEMFLLLLARNRHVSFSEFHLSVL